MKTAKDVIETRRESINAIVGENKDHGWGQADSMAVIGDLLAEFGGAFARHNPPLADDDPASRNEAELRDAVLGCIDKLVNPSACRQWLASESVGVLNKAEKGQRGRSQFAEF